MTKSKGKAICLAVMLTVMLPVIAAGQPAIPVWGEWTQDQTVSGCYEIRSGDTLVIYPGVNVSLAAAGKLIVRGGGTLVVNQSDTGCPSEVARVVFDEAVAGAGWQGIVVEDGGTATLRYVDIMNAADTGLKVMSGATVGAMQYVTFSGCSGTAGGGLYTETSLTISNALFSANSAVLYGGGIECVGGTLTLADVDFIDNTAGYSGGAIDILSAGLLQVRGIVSGNSSPSGSAIMLYGGGATITNGFFYDQAGGPVVSRIGTLALQVAYSTFNGNADACIAGNSDNTVTIGGSILYGNGSALALMADGGAVPSITYSDVEDIGTYPSGWFGAGNLDVDPDFVMAGDYTLSASSPCIGAAAGEDMGVTGGMNAPGPAPTLIDMTGAAVADPFDLGTASVGGSITRTVQIVNDGQADATILALDITGAQAAAFSLAAVTLPVTLAPGECLDLEITFAPTAPGDYTLADLVITHSAGTLVNGLAGDTQEGTGNDLTVTPVTVNFGNVLVNTDSVPMSFTLTNPLANGGLVPVELAVSGSDAGFFTLSEDSFTIPEGGSRTVWATFSPNALRSFEAIVTPTVNGVERPDRAVLLVGVGNDMIFTVSPTPHEYQFPPTVIGLSNDTTVNVANLLTSTSILVSAAISGPGAANFSLDMPSAAIDVSPDSQDFTVIFSPVVDGFVQATLTFTSILDGITYTETFDLRGVGIGTTAGIAVGPTSINFADTSVGGTTTNGFLVVNLLDDFVSVTVSSPAAAQFSFASASSFILFPAGDAGNRDERVVYIDFAPTDATTLFSTSVDVVGTLGIYTVGSDTVTMQGRGIAAAIDIAPDAIDFGDVDLGTTSSTVSVSVLNTGTEDANIFAGLLGGTNAAEFNIDTDTCSLTTLPPGAGCYYEVSVTPAAEGALVGTLSIYTSVSPTATVVDLSATGVVGAAASISVSPLTIDMGDVAVFIPSTSAPGVGSVVVTNTGDTADLVVSGITFNGYHAAQFIATPAGPFTLVPGASQTVAVTLYATGLGPRATTMTIASNAGDVDVTVSGDSQVGYTNVDGFGWNADATYSFVHARDEALYVIPGVFDLYYRQLITALDVLGLPVDGFVWAEGAGYLQYLDNGGVWQTVAAEDEIQSTDLAATLALDTGSLITSPTFPAEGEFTIHYGFDLVRDNMITDLPYFYVDFARTVIYGPHPFLAVAPDTLTLGDADPTAIFGGLDSLAGGSSITNVEVYVWAMPAGGGVLYLDGTLTWSATQAPIIPTIAANVMPFFGISDPWSGYAIGDQEGTHTIYVTYDRTLDGVLNDRVFEASQEVVVNPVP